MARTSNTICEICNKHYYKRPSQKGGRDFCSMKCYATGKIIDKTKTCEKCKKKYTYNRRYQRFCSLRCATTRKRTVRVNGNGRNKTRTVQQDLKAIGWDGMCMIVGCFYNKTLDNHRVVKGVDGGTYDLYNVSVLCPNHHAEVHRLKLILTKKGKFAFELC